MKRILSSLLTLAVVFSISFGATASAADVTSQETAGDRAVSAYAAELDAYVNNELNNKSLLKTTVDEIALDKIVSSFIADHGTNYDVKLLKESTKKETILVDNESKIVIDGAVVTVYGNNTVEATPDRIANGAIDISNASLARASGTTPIVSYYYAAYGAVLGQELWRVTQEAQFTYTGSSVTVNYSNGFYTRGFLSIWQVSDWDNSKESSILVNNTWTKKVTSSGNFHYGLEYEGVGVVVQDLYVTIDARCTVNGATSGYYNVN